MIYHCNRIKLKEGITPEQYDEAMESLRDQGRIPAVKSFVVGAERGSDFDLGAVFVLEDLDGYSEYLVHPAHVRAERLGIPLLEKFDSYDVVDDPDPELSDKIADLQKRNYENRPELAELMGSLGSNTGGTALTIVKD